MSKLAISNPKNLIFGRSPKPVATKSGMVIGGGQVYPEINFTLPPMLITAETMNRVEEHYREMIAGTLKRAAELQAPGVVVEFETLPPMTENPDWGMRVVQILLDGMEAERSRSGLKSALRMTPNDTREMERPPRMRSGALYDAMLELFERSAAAGCEFLSIESVGGKEVHDDALMLCDIKQVIFSLCVLGSRDMEFLWTKLAGIAKKHGVHAAGDTACGFSNTSMVLAEQKMIPRVFAAVDRTVSAVRSLEAYRAGAVGPGKDCGYENIILKAITGCPMANEGRMASGAHLSPVGNIAGAACDTWSNESIQNVKLLGAMAPVVGMEQLAFDCRLFNKTLEEGADSALQYQRWLVESDCWLDPQGVILRPDSAIRAAEAIVSAETPFLAGIAVAETTVSMLQEAKQSGRLVLNDRESAYLEKISYDLSDMTRDEEAFINEMMDEVEVEKFRPEDYLIG